MTIEISITCDCCGDDNSITRCGIKDCEECDGYYEDMLTDYATLEDDDSRHLCRNCESKGCTEYEDKCND